MKVIILALFLSSSAFSQRKDVEVLDLGKIDLDKEEMNLKDLEKENSPESKKLDVEDIAEPPGKYQYSSFGKKDPFQVPSLNSSDEDKKNKKFKSTTIRIVSPLQKYSLDQLEVKGVWVHRSGETRAVVMTPKREGIVVKKGDPISSGKVLHINRRRILVRQYSIRIDGSRDFNDVELPIGGQKPDEKEVLTLTPGGGSEYGVGDPSDELENDGPPPRNVNK